MQTKVNITQALGIVGSWVNDALKSAVGYVIKGSNQTEAVKATATLTFSENAEEGDTVTINGAKYTFSKKASENPFVVLIGTGKTDTATSLAAVINATSPFASASAAAPEGGTTGGVVTLTAREGGAAANGMGVASSTNNITATKFSGGADTVFADDATVGNAFTLDTDGQAKMGGDGKFVGILTNPHNYAVYNHLEATLKLPDGTQGILAKSGYLNVVLSTTSEVGDKVYFVRTTGALGAGKATDSQTQIAGAQVITGGKAGSVVQIGIIPQV